MIKSSFLEVNRILCEIEREWKSFFGAPGINAFQTL